MVNYNSYFGFKMIPHTIWPFLLFPIGLSLLTLIMRQTNAIVKNGIILEFHDHNLESPLEMHSNKYIHSWYWFIISWNTHEHLLKISANWRKPKYFYRKTNARLLKPKKLNCLFALSWKKSGGSVGRFFILFLIWCITADVKVPHLFQ